MFTEEGPPKIAGESDESETVNFSVGSSSRSFDIPILAYRGSVSPGWKVTSLTAASKSVHQPYLIYQNLALLCFFFSEKSKIFHVMATQMLLIFTPCFGFVSYKYHPDLHHIPRFSAMPEFALVIANQNVYRL